MEQDIITWGLITVFIVWEFSVFFKTLRKIKSFKQIFPNAPNSLYSVTTDKKNVQIYTMHKSELFKNIIDTINKYLDSNYGSISDYI